MRERKKFTFNLFPTFSHSREVRLRFTTTMDSLSNSFCKSCNRCGQSCKDSANGIYNSRVVHDLNIFFITSVDTIYDQRAFKRLAIDLLVTQEGWTQKHCYELPLKKATILCQLLRLLLSWQSAVFLPTTSHPINRSWRWLTCCKFVKQRST